MHEDVDARVSALVDSLYAEAVGTIRTIEIDVQSSGECPYRVHVLEEQLPVIGLARVEPLPETTPEDITSVADEHGGTT